MASIPVRCARAYTWICVVEEATGHHPDDRANRIPHAPIDDLAELVRSGHQLEEAPVLQLLDELSQARKTIGALENDKAEAEFSRDTWRTRARRMEGLMVDLKINCLPETNKEHTMRVEILGPTGESIHTFEIADTTTLEDGVGLIVASLNEQGCNLARTSCDVALDGQRWTAISLHRFHPATGTLTNIQNSTISAAQ